MVVKKGHLLGQVGQTSLFALILFFSLFTISCVRQNDITIKSKNSKKTENLTVTVSNVKVENHQIVITGTNLNSVSDFKIKDGTTTTNLQIESQSSTSLVANTLSSVTFATGKMLDFVFTNAQAASTFTVNFSLCDSILRGRGFDCSLTPPNDKDVLTYDAVSGKWTPTAPSAPNGLTYQGVWDALNDPMPTGISAGDYYVVSVEDAPNYYVGDWIVYNGTTFERVPNSQAVSKVFGRAGIVVPLEGDYNLNLLGDVDLTVAPTTSQVLKYNGTKWVAGSVITSESDPSVQAFAKAALPTCTTGQVLKSNGTTFSCVADAGGTGFSGTANRVVQTDGTGALSVSTISTTVLGFISGVTSNIQTQIDSKLNSSSFVDWSTTGVQTIDPTRLNLMTTNRVMVTNASANPAVSTVTSTELGYLSGVTSSIQTQLNTKISSETDPSVATFAKTALPTCGAGEVLKSNGTIFSCVSDNTGSGAFTGPINSVVITDATTGALSTSAVMTVSPNAFKLNPFGTGAGQTGEIRFYELAASGSNYTAFKSPDTVAANIIYTLPVTAPTAGQILSSDASGVLSWVANSGGGAVDSVNTKTGVVVLTTSDIAEGTNLYHSDARVLATPITAPTLTNSAIATSDSVQVSLGKLQAQTNAKLNSSSFVDWSTTGVQTIAPSRLNLTTANRVVITNASSIPEASTVTSTELGYLSGVTSSIQTQLNSKISAETDPNVSAFAKAALPTCGAGEVLKSNGSTFSCVADNTGSGAFTGPINSIVITDGTTGALSTSAAMTVSPGSFNLNPFGTGAGQTGEIRFYELAASGSNYTAFKSPDTLGANIVYTLPQTAPTNGQVLTSNGSGVLSWTTNSAAPVTSVNTLTGAVVLTTSEIGEGTNKYYTDAKVLAAPITAPTLTNSAIATSDTVLVSLGKLQAQINNRETSITAGASTQYLKGDKTLGTFLTDVMASVLTGLSTATNMAIAAGDNILGAFGKLQAQITALDSSKLNKTGGTLSVGTISGVPTPTNADDVANKDYVDTAVTNATGSNPQDPAEYSPTCPTGYVSVPAMAYYPTPSFCVMKWEAKTGSSSVAATTAAAGLPVDSIIRDDARAACRLIGPGFDLISNAQWQTIARNIADQDANWSSGTAYAGELNRGHSDASPDLPLAASTDTDACSGTEQTCSDTLWDSQRRTHTLSNGEVIWDIGGNMWEWVSDHNSSAQGAALPISMTNSGNNAQIRFGNDQFCGSPTVSPFCGMGNAWVSGTSAAVLRSGGWPDDLSTSAGAGVFAVSFAAPTFVDTAVGFRCVFVP